MTQKEPKKFFEFIRSSYKKIPEKNRKIRYTDLIINDEEDSVKIIWNAVTEIMTTRNLEHLGI